MRRHWAFWSSWHALDTFWTMYGCKSSLIKLRPKIHQKWNPCSGFGKGLDVEPKNTKWDKKCHWSTPNTTKRLPEVTKSTPKGYQIDAKTSPDHSNDAQGQKVWFFNDFLTILGYHFGTIFVPRSTKMLKTIRPKINAEKIPTIYPKIMQKPCPNDGQI